MTDHVAFTVSGPAKAQGSKAYKGHRNGKPILVESSKGLAPWRNSVRLVAGRRSALLPRAGPQCEARGMAGRHRAGQPWAAP